MCRDRQPGGRQSGLGGPIPAAGQLPVPGQAGRVGAVAPGQGVGEPPVQSAAFARQQVGVEDLPGQRVRQGVAVPGRDQQPQRHRLAGGGQQLPLRQRHGRGEQFVGHPVVGHRDLVDHLPHPVVDAGHPCQHDLGEGGRRPVRAGVHQLLGVERIAVGGRHHGGHPRGVRARRQGGHQLGDLAVGEDGEPQPGHPGALGQFGEPAPGVAAQVLLPQRRHHQHPLPVQPYREEGQQLAGGLVGPVQVLQHQDQRGDGGQVGQQGEHPLEQPLPGGRRLTRAVVGEQPVGPVPQRRHERPVRQRGPAQRDGLADPQLCGAVGRVDQPAQFRDQPGLAEARLPGDEEYLGPAARRALERRCRGLPLM
jgi:hypothetical protein